MSFRSQLREKAMQNLHKLSERDQRSLLLGSSKLITGKKNGAAEKHRQLNFLTPDTKRSSLQVFDCGSKKRNSNNIRKKDADFDSLLIAPDRDKADWWKTDRDLGDRSRRAFKKDASIPKDSKKDKRSTGYDQTSSRRIDRLAGDDRLQLRDFRDDREGKGEDAMRRRLVPKSAVRTHELDTVLPSALRNARKPKDIPLFDQDRQQTEGLERQPDEEAERRGKPRSFEHSDKQVSETWRLRDEKLHRRMTTRRVKREQKYQGGDEDPDKEDIPIRKSTAANKAKEAIGALPTQVEADKIREAQMWRDLEDVLSNGV